MARPTPCLLALLLSGCASLAPRYAAPAPPLAERFEADGAGVPVPAWRDYFTDPRLRVLIARALDANRDLRTAALHVEEARARYGIRRNEALPMVGVQAGMDRLRIPALPGLTGGPLTFTAYQVALGMSAWELDFWGRVRSLKDAALETFLASDEARWAVSLRLVAQVAGTYYAVGELGERITLARATIASRTETLRIFARRVEVGSTSRFDLTQVRTLLTQAQALGEQLTQAREAQAHALAVLVGGPLEEAFLPDHLDGRFPLAELRPGLPSDLLATRPDLVAAEHQLKAAHADIGAARAAFFPRIALTASAGTASAELHGLFREGSGTWRFSPSISLPILDWGRRRDNLDLARTRRDLAVAGYERAVQVAFRDVADALSSRRGCLALAAIARDALDAQQERARLSRLRYDAGAAAFLEVLESQRDLLSAEQQLVQTRRAVLTSGVELFAALGGGPQT